nr:peptidoglycan DD-metalloendopeptidase family protein [Marinobacterium litorale]
MRKVSNIVSGLPKIHLAAATICTGIIGASLLLPSNEVEATRSTIKLITPKSETTVTSAAAKADQNAKPAESSTENNPVALTTDAQQTASFDSTGMLEATEEQESLASPAPIIENWIEYEVRSGDSLSTLFKRAGLSARDVYQVSQATQEAGVLKRLYPGQTLSFLIEGGEMEKLRFSQDQLNSVQLERTEDGYKVEHISLTPDVEQRIVSGKITNSLFLDAERAGLSGRMIMQMAQILGWDIDFALDIRKNDSFRVLYEEKFLDGKKIGEGDVLAVEFKNRGRTVRALRFVDSNGDTNYYTPEGESMRKAFLRSPVDFRRISSSFNPERYHPVLGKKRPHRGTDYAAATGTPIKAAGDGKIIWRGTKGGYGKTIILQHGGNITTLYAHMNGYKSGLSAGSRVKQGQVIGYVGKTGMVTGPHLHYEFRVNGVHKNPVTVALPHAQPVPSKERAAFTKQSSQLLALLEGETTIALADNDR